MKLAFIAHGVHRHGGMERAAAEALERIACRHEVVVIAIRCEAQAPLLSWIPVRVPPRPHLSLVWTFRPAAARAEKQANATLTAAIGASASGSEVVIAQFCFASYAARFGKLRGRTSLARRLYQVFADQVDADAERRTYISPRLRRVIAVSEGTKRELIAEYKLPPEKIVVIPNGVDGSVFKPAGSAAAKSELRRRLGLPKDKFLALFVGGDWERKGVADGIRAMAGLPDAVYVVVGGGDQEAYRAIAREAGVDKQVIFAGVTPKPQEYFAAADVFVFPSRYEAFSLVTLEAAAAGLPIIALRINGTEELIEEGVNGYFIGGGETESMPEQIGARLRLLAGDESLRERMSGAILASSREYDWDSIAARQNAVFEEVAREMQGG